ncbi:CHASE3 domain-containing protein, partial [Azospirillum sp. A39]|uniref:CHASE3 domain-containing protein n=1 Tax=Azospirillum sp. A39 TaxID=3462279 RepID=UPI004046088A
MSTAAPRAVGTTIFANLKVRTKIYVGFGVVLSLLVGLGVSSWLTARNGDANLAAYTAQSEIALLSAQSDTALLQTRLILTRFYATGKPTDIDAFRSAASELERYVADAKAKIADGEDRKAADRILGLLAQYVAGFDRLAALREQQSRLTKSVLDEMGMKIRSLFAAVRDGEAEEGRVETLATAAQLDAEFLLARTVAARFATAQDPADRTKTAKFLATVQEKLQRLQAMPLAPEQQRRLSEAASLLPAYVSGFEELAGTLVETEQLVSGSIAAVGRDMAKESAVIRNRAAQLQASVAAEATQDARDAETSAVTLSA